MNVTRKGYRPAQAQAQLSVPDEPGLPNPLQVITESDVDEADCENTVDPDDDEEIDIEP